MIDDYSLPDLFRVRQKLIQAQRHRHPGQVAVSGLVGPVNQVTRPLKFYRQEIRCADVDSLGFHALSITSAEHDLVSPERESVGIRLSIEKVAIMLPHKISGIVDRIHAADGSDDVGKTNRVRGTHGGRQDFEVGREFRNELMD